MKKLSKRIVFLLIGGLVLVSTFAFLMFSSQEVSALSNSDFLKTNGTTVRKNNGTGELVYLRGTNAGGWLVQESWMNPTNAGDQKTMMNTFASRFGTATRDELISVYEDNYWTTQDFDNCANMGMSAIRLPFTYMNLCDDNGNLKANAWDRLDWFVSNCSQRGMYVILDLHGTFGSQNGMDHSGEVNDGYKLYWDSYNRSKTIWLWQEIARHFKDNPAVAGYDILNEPGIKAGTTYDLHWALYDEIYDAIRAIDGNHIIIMESCWTPSNLPNPSTYGWTNVMYEYHHYTWDYVSNYDGQVSSCNNFINSINQSGHNVPVLVGEFTCFNIEGAWNYVLDSFNNNGLHYTSWSYKATGSSTSWGIYNHTPQSVDIYNDSASTIRSKWGSAIQTSAGWANTMVYNVLKNHFPGTIKSSNPTVTIANGEYYFTSIANSKVVCADNTGADILAANRDSCGGSWETIEIINNSDGTVSFKSNANGLYLCAVLDESNQIIARSSTIGTWEKFYIVKINDTQYAIRSAENGKYIQANINDGGRLYAVSDTIAGAWEAFNITRLGSTVVNNPYAGDITIYQDINYGGNAVSLKIGEYNLSTLASIGFKNDDLTSIKVPFGYKVTLYMNDNFGGTSKVLTADSNWIGSDWNDKMSSMKVEYAVYTITSRHSNLVLDIDSWNSADGTNVLQWHNTGGANQQWKFIRTNDAYQIISIMNNKALEVGGWSTDNGGNVQMWTNFIANNQLWYITSDAGYTVIKNVHSGKALDVANVSTTPAENIHQWDYVGGANQQWILTLVN